MKAYINMSDQAVEERNKRALDDLCWRIMNDEEGRPFDWIDFLDEQTDIPMLLCQYRNDLVGFMSNLESRLRAELADSEAVERRAEELAQEESA